MKTGSKVEKFVPVRKFNHYTTEQCQDELKRMENVSGMGAHGNQTNSVYYREVQKQLKVLSAKLQALSRI